MLCYFMLLFLSFLCLHHFLSIFTFPLSFFFPLDVQLFLFYISSSFQPSTFIPILCLRLFPSDSRQTQWAILIFSHNLLVRVLVSSCPCQLEQKGETSGLTNFSFKHKHSLSAFQDQGWDNFECCYYLSVFQNSH